MQPRTFKRRIGAISSMDKWASDPSRSAVSGVPRNPIPGRSQLPSEKSTRGFSDEQMGLLMAADLDRNAQRDYALVRGSYLLGCTVSEIAVIRWQDIEVLDDGGQPHILGKGSKRRVVGVSSDTLALFEGLSAERSLAMSAERGGDQPDSAVRRLATAAPNKYLLFAWICVLLEGLG